MEERNYVPYESSLLPGERFVVLAPHPDDEVLGAGGSMALLAAQGRKVHVHILTGGSEQGDPETRQSESRKAMETLGIDEPTFHDFPDRGLSSREGDLKELILSILHEENPDCLILPGPHEAHPDHRALAAVLLTLLHELRPGDRDFGLIRDLTLAFMEISLPQQINHLVDISSVIETKSRALALFSSQQAFRDYAEKMAGLNAYRSTTLLPPATHAEGFRVMAAGSAALHPLTDFFPQGLPFAPASPTISISLIIRTRNRLSLLEEALRSVSEAEAPPEQVIVVNDGGEDPGPVVSRFSTLPVEVISFPACRGRGVAANEGLRRSSQDAVAFLDDDDIVYPEHFQTLRRAMGHANVGVVYSDAVSTIHGWDDNGTPLPPERHLSYGRDFDPDLLLYDNYIPFHTLLIRRSLIDQSGLLREDLDLFEDWEFLIRLSSLTPFHHVRRVTCAYRHFRQGATLGVDPTSRQDFSRARCRVLELTREKRSPEVEERVVRRLRITLDQTREKLVEFEGELQYHRRTSEQLSREVHRLGSDLGQVSDALHRERGEWEKERLESRDQVVAVREELGEREEALKKLQLENSQHQDHLRAAFEEIERLNGILSQIYASRTWKLHTMAERLKGRKG
ncbi:MAG TPA: PIG-L family deacetylase [Thermoanaerobaculia bacterium]|nr:PIG-L family deacetylase [Thermoanaerobaculia bacterium]HUM31179.1 PIG-L family deacetylase [Thermoanaerobaculia bacterium]HXK69521.1 PIG-L family deacetylase [Thermoanaerobaculia bacterium]